MTFLAYYAMRDGDLEAPARYSGGAEQYRLAGDAAGVGGCIHCLGDLALEQGDVAPALARYLEAQPSVLRDGSVLDLEYAFAGYRRGRRALASLLGNRPRGCGASSERLDANAERKMDHDDPRALYERALGALDEREVEAGRALSDDEVVALLQPTAADLAASLRSSA